jgi:hypothetical protein
MCSLLFIYNAALFWGFLNFLFGLGIVLLGFSAWVATRNWPLAPRVIAFSVVASALFVLHLFAFGIYGLSVMSYELGRHIDTRRLSIARLLAWCAAGLQFVPALILWAASLKDSASDLILYGSLWDKFLAATAPVSFDPEPILLDGVMAVFCVGFLLFCLGTRSLTLAPGMRLPIISMLVAAVLMPSWLSGSWGADMRLPIALPFLIIASTRLEFTGRPVIRVFAIAAVALLGVRVSSVSESWSDHDHLFAEFRAATHTISPGSRLLLVQERPLPEAAQRIDGVPTAFARRWGQSFWHLPALAVIDRAAFIPFNMFTGWTPIQPTPRNEGLFETQGWPLTTEMLVRSAEPEQTTSIESPAVSPAGPTYSEGWPGTFDYVVRIDFSHASDLHLQTLQLVATGSFFQIYRVIRP